MSSNSKLIENISVKKKPQKTLKMLQILSKNEKKNKIAF